MDYPFDGSPKGSLCPLRYRSSCQCRGGEMELMSTMGFETAIPNGLDITKWNVYRAL